MEEWQRQAIIRAVLAGEGVSAGAISPGDLYTFYGDEIQVSEDGAVLGIDETIGRARRERPYLFRPISKIEQETSGGNPARQ